jgi:formylglycine-generating enzyme required for sulfatase activity
VDWIHLWTSSPHDWEIHHSCYNPKYGKVITPTIIKNRHSSTKEFTMTRIKFPVILLLSLTLITISIFYTSSSPTQAASDSPDYSSYLTPSVATLNTYRVSLIMQNFMAGERPPSSKWYGPDGSQVSAGCIGGSVLRDYEYSYGSLVKVTDYFYVRGCDREPGVYRVMVGSEVNRTFRIKGFYSYLPLLMKPLEAPGAFTKTYPEDKATGVLETLTLDWSDSLGADAYSYCIDTSDDSACDSWVDVGASSQVTLTNLISDTTYFWQVSATNPLGTVYADGDPAAYYSFTVRTPCEVIPGEMILIPEGEFPMGCHPDHNTGVDCWSWELPLHTVYLDAYRIDKHEVTNGQYYQCVAAGACNPPADFSSYTRSSYYGNPMYDEFPVVNVTWQDAADYCSWAGKYLPSEAQWEKAGRGTTVQTFPWGDAPPTCSLVNFSASYDTRCVGDTSAVGDYPDGASPYGLLDMSGNVSEWVADWFASDYYDTSPDSNPPGPASGTDRVRRGGSYGNMGMDITVAGRSYRDPANYYDYLGFRCAAPPE